MVMMRPRVHDTKVMKDVSSVNWGPALRDSTTTKASETLAATGGMLEPRAIEVESHLQVDSDAGPPGIELVNTHDLADKFAVHGVMGRGIRERDEDAHSRIVGLSARNEIDAVFRDVHADGQVFKMIVPRFGGTDAHGLRDLRAAAAPFFGGGRFGLGRHGGLRGDRAMIPLYADRPRRNAES